MFFSLEFCKESREKFPDLKSSQHMSNAGVKWGTMSDSDKLKFKNLYEKDVARYQK